MAGGTESRASGQARGIVARLWSARLPRARAAVATGLLLSGASFASWVVRIPEVQRRLELSESTLGLTLFGVAAGGMLAMPLSGLLIGRYGSRPVALAALLSLAGSVALAPHAVGAFSLAAVLFMLGAATSVAAVALNTQAAAVERRMRRPIMSRLHALYSVGGLVGAGVGGLAAGSGVGAGWHLGVAAALVAAVALAIAPSLLRPGTDGVATEVARARFARPGRPLLLLGVVAFCVLFGEGAVADWSAVYLRDEAGAGPGLAAAGFAAFSLMMAAGRFAGDALTVRLGPAGAVRLGGFVAALGNAVAVVQNDPLLMVLGFAATGAGLSIVFPAVIAAAGRVSGSTPSSAITVVSSIGYLGLLAGPPLIGIVGEAVSLSVGMAIVSVGGLLIAGLAGILPAAQPFAHRRPRAPSQLVRVGSPAA
ncbi:MAG TPA: MFS transporter [Longimicrobiaceae bacterium]|nr:MFS transporter [Longimicrobiaceae bacterium]